MTEYTSMKELLIGEFTENYLKKLFYFCLKKTGNSTEAEDLASDIALSILSSLNNGTVPRNFSAWVWTIARNRYSQWAANKHRRRACESELEDEYTDVLSSADVEGELIRREEYALLRRELAFVSSDYRNIVLAY
ncbi:MAG: sigma-70 family RNA polymerase sigma factor, partial [Clostridia bacterium]|nr:sigma-70 family RNA polymerase sigma factor [Clostridia bacterium]